MAHSCEDTKAELVAFLRPVHTRRFGACEEVGGAVKHIAHDEVRVTYLTHVPSGDSLTTARVLASHVSTALVTLNVNGLYYSVLFCHPGRLSNRRRRAAPHRLFGFGGVVGALLYMCGAAFLKSPRSSPCATHVDHALCA
ncbi:hypothetical protein B0H19DRAFT_1273814 [Mycena capillaripes]|nr:hypothetical protein B0H19DRAFT_1273814 [Mycena capillaripes]